MSVECFFDTNILVHASSSAAARSLDADILFTEDLAHGQLYGSLRVVNPFR